MGAYSLMSRAEDFLPAPLIRDVPANGGGIGAGVQIGDVIISGEDKWTDVVGNNLYDLIPQDGRDVTDTHPLLLAVLGGEVKFGVSWVNSNVNHGNGLYGLTTGNALNLVEIVRLACTANTAYTLKFKVGISQKDMIISGIQETLTDLVTLPLQVNTAYELQVTSDSGGSVEVLGSNQSFLHDDIALTTPRTLEDIPNLTNSPFPYKRVADLT